MIILYLLVHYQFTGKNIELARQVISNDPHSTYVEIIAETSFSHGTIERIIHDYFTMKRVTSRGVPRQLTHEQRVKLCHKNLTKFQNGSRRLCHIITDDETWIYHRQIHHKSKKRKLTWPRSVTNYYSSSKQI